MKKFIFLLDDLRLTFHWYHIRKLRSKAAALINKGTGCFHPELVRYSNKILSHGMVVSAIWQRQKKYSPCYIELDMDDSQSMDNTSIAL